MYVTLQGIFNTRLKKLSLVVFCGNFSTLQQKPHDYICSGCKNMVSQKMYGFYWATLYLHNNLNHSAITRTTVSTQVMWPETCPVTQPLQAAHSIFVTGHYAMVGYSRAATMQM